MDILRLLASTLIIIKGPQYVAQVYCRPSARTGFDLERTCSTRTIGFRTSSIMVGQTSRGVAFLHRAGVVSSLDRLFAKSEIFYGE